MMVAAPLQPDFRYTVEAQPLPGILREDNQGTLPALTTADASSEPHPVDISSPGLPGQHVRAVLFRSA